MKTGINQFPVRYRLMSVTVLCSTNGLFVLILRFFNFLCLCMIAYFMSSNDKFLTSPNEGIKTHSRKNIQRWKKAYLNMSTVFVI